MINKKISAKKYLQIYKLHNKQEFKELIQTMKITLIMSKTYQNPRKQSHLLLTMNLNKKYFYHPLQKDISQQKIESI